MVAPDGAKGKEFRLGFDHPESPGPYPSHKSVCKGRGSNRSRRRNYPGLPLVGTGATGLGAVIPQFVGRWDARGIRIQQAFVVGAEAELDKRPRVGRDLGLPAVVG